MDYDELYRGRYYDVSSVYDHIIRIRQRYFPPRGLALDHGFGNGVIAAYLQREGFDTYGVETSQGAVDRAIEEGLDPAKFVTIDVDFPFADNMFDVVVSNQVFSFIEPDTARRTVDEIFRVLKPGGKLAATLMADTNYWFDKVTGHGWVRVQLSGRIERDWMQHRATDEEWRTMFSRFIIDDFGYFDFRLLDVRSAKHHILLARKPE